MIRTLISVALLTLLTTTHASVAQEKDVAALEKSAIGVLEKTCSGCHQLGKLKGKYAKEGSPKGFNYILDPKELLRSKKIIPGNPDSSPLFIRAGVLQDMPPFNDNCLEVTPPEGTPCQLSTNDVLALREYISALGTASASADKTAPAEPPRIFVTDDDIIRTIASDLEKFTEGQRSGKRYLTLTHFYNSGEDEKSLELYRQATVKLLNALSHESDPIQLETIDANKTIIRFDLGDLGWDAKIWDRIVEANPYLVIYKNPMFDGFVVPETHSITPILRADWFTFAASQPPLYYDILNLPDTKQALEKLLGLNVFDDINNYKVDRAGFQKSGVSVNNRMIERHSIPTGSYWESYDFAGNVDRQSIFKFPLGPKGALGNLSEEFGYEHNGGEVIFTLPNGFHAYYLTNAKGNRLDKGPQNIVLDELRRDKAVTNGISCMGCHDAGIKFNPNRPPDEQDEILTQVENSLSFPGDVKDVVRELFPTHDKFAALMKKDANAYEAALTAAGVNMKLNSNGREMINTLFTRFEEDLGAAQAAAELGFTKEEFLRRLDAAGAGAYDLKQRLLLDNVPRDQFVQDFAELVTELTENTSVTLKHVADQSHDAVPVKTAVDLATARNFDLAFFPNQEKFVVKKQVTFTVKSERACYLTLTNIDGKGRVVVIFPNKFNQNNKIAANVKYLLPGKEVSGFAFEFTEPGKETVVAACNADNPNPPGLVHDFNKEDFTSFDSYGKYLEASKQIRVTGAGAAAQTGGNNDVVVQKGVVLNVKAK